MTPGQRKARKAMERAKRASMDFQSELTACMRELDEAADMDTDGLGNDEPTQPAVPRPSSRTMPAVTGLSHTVGNILEEGRRRP